MDFFQKTLFSSLLSHINKTDILKEKEPFTLIWEGSVCLWFRQAQFTLGQLGISDTKTWEKDQDQATYYGFSQSNCWLAAFPTKAQVQGCWKVCRHVRTLQSTDQSEATNHETAVRQEISALRLPRTPGISEWWERDGERVRARCVHRGPVLTACRRRTQCRRRRRSATSQLRWRGPSLRCPQPPGRKHGPLYIHVTSSPENEDLGPHDGISTTISSQLLALGES